MDNNHYKIGILGGTFDPIHYGHLMLAQSAFETFHLDFVLIMPAAHPYFKDGTNVSSGENRCDMVKLAIEDDKRFIFSNLEFLRQGDTYTADTLEALKEEYPLSDLYFILGSDTLFEIESWKEPKRIFELASVISTKRNVEDEAVDIKIEELRAKYNASIFNLYQPNIDISSTDIRKRVADDLSIKYYAPDKVIEYIKANDLYKTFI